MRRVTERPRPWKRLRTVRSEDYQILQVREDVFADPRTGEEHARVIIDANEWANVVAITPDDKVVMVRQWRFGSQAEGLEIPGGVVDKGETPEEAATRELEEETGYRPGTIESVGWLWSNPATSPTGSTRSSPGAASGSTTGPPTGAKTW